MEGAGGSLEDEEMEGAGGSLEALVEAGQGVSPVEEAGWLTGRPGGGLGGSQVEGGRWVHWKA